MSHRDDTGTFADDPRGSGPSLGDARDFGVSTGPRDSASAEGGGRPRFAQYRTTFVGLVMVLGGVAGAGCFLVAAGGGDLAGSVILGALTVALLVIGFVLVVTSSHARGGMLAGDPTPLERRNYRSMYRGPHPSAH